MIAGAAAWRHGPRQQQGSAPAGHQTSSPVAPRPQHAARRPDLDARGRPTQDRCAAPTPEILAQYPLAFQGTVTSIEDDTVTIETSEVLTGEVGETVLVTAPRGVRRDDRRRRLRGRPGLPGRGLRRPALAVLHRIGERKLRSPFSRRSSTEDSRNPSRCRPGSRMGRPKALVHDADGASWLQQAVDVLRDGGCDGVTVVLGAGADEAVRLLDGLGVDVVVAHDWARGHVGFTTIRSRVAQGQRRRGRRGEPGRPARPDRGRGTTCAL